jgi:hypothetical protein
MPALAAGAARAVAKPTNFGGIALSEALIRTVPLKARDHRWLQKFKINLIP